MRRMMEGVRLTGMLAVLAVSVATALAQTPAQPEAASGHRARPAVSAPSTMAVTANPHATSAAVATLRAGGSAVDAAIAALLVLNVVEPQSSGIGGGGFLVHYERAKRRVTTWDGRETAPAAIDERWFLTADGSKMAFYDAVVGGRAVGVPGQLRLLEAAHARFGQRPWAELFAPAIRLARDGFPVSPRLHALIARDRHLASDVAARALYFDADGAPLAVGAMLRNPALADVLEGVARDGVEHFYTGEIARDIVAAVGRAPNPGRMSLQDLAAYRVVERDPLCGRYRAYRVCGMPPPSSGAGTVLSLLGVLERFNLSSLDPDSAFVGHLFADAGRLAFADRDAWYGDPAAMTVRPAQLLDAAYLRRRADAIRLGDSIDRAEPGQPASAPVPQSADVIDRPSTTHISIVDADGNAVSLTASIEDAFGSRRMVRGFLLNNQLTDFAFQPVDARGAHPNRPGPGKRPRSSMAPTIVFDPQGELFAVTGSPGGSQIINYVAASLVGVIDWRMAPDAILARPHVGSRNGPTEVEDTSAGRVLAEALSLFGHDTTVRDLTSGVGLIVRREGRWTGAADPRREGAAAGY